MRKDSAALHATMVDFYGLPASGQRAWPGRSEAARLTHAGKGQHVQQAMLEDLARRGGDARRFVPFVTMHEFEGLLFSDCDAFAQALDEPTLASRLQHIRNQFASPEHINDSPTLAPSKRVLREYPAYQKSTDGVDVAAAVSLERILEECPHFADWLDRLEAAAGRS